MLKPEENCTMNEDDLFNLEFSEFMNVFEEEWKRKILEDDWDDFYEKGEE